MPSGSSLCTPLWHIVVCVVSVCVCVFMFKHIRAYVCVQKHMYLCMCMWKPEVDIAVSLNFSLPYGLRQHLLPRHWAHRFSPSSLLAPGTLSLPLRSWYNKWAITFIWVLDNQTLVLLPGRQALRFYPHFKDGVSCFPGWLQLALQSDKGDSELLILPPPPKFWGHTHVPPASMLCLLLIFFYLNDIFLLLRRHFAT